jgi:hypothetical protein
MELIILRRGLTAPRGNSIVPEAGESLIIGSGPYWTPPLRMFMAFSYKLLTVQKYCQNFWWEEILNIE